MVYTEAAPHAALAHIVACYWTIEGGVSAGEELTNRVLPDGCMDVIFNVGDAPKGGIGDLPEPGYVVGAMLRALVVRLRGRVDMVGVRFRPGAAGTYLGVPATELTAGSVGLSALRREAASLAEQVADAGAKAAGSAWPGAEARAVHARLGRRARLLDRVLLAAGGAEPDRLVAAAVRLIECSSGGITVSDLERRLGVSARTLTRRFSAAVGIPPKTACRVARLQSAAGEIRRDPDVSLARIAVRAGFHDQAHLTRDFRDLAGVTPAGYALESRGGFVQDDVGVSA